MTFKEFITALPGSPYALPTFLRIPDSNIEGERGVPGPFEAKKHYFTIRVNEMYIHQSRKWFSELEPMVVCLTEYSYDGSFVGNPMIVGSNMLKNKMKGDGKGFCFRDTRVAGIHPYAGGRMILSIGLYENEIDNYLRKSIKFLESISSVFNSHVTIFLKNITKASQVIMDGVDELLESKKTKPLFGLRKEFDPAVGEEFTAGYYVLLNKLDKEMTGGDFYVDDQNKLKYIIDGKKQDFRETEYILFSFIKTDQRSDDSLLPLYKNYGAILDFAKEHTTIGDQEKEKIKDMLRVLNFDMAKSPDITEADAQRFMKAYITKIKELLDARFVLGGSSRKQNESLLENIDRQIIKL